MTRDLLNSLLDHAEQTRRVWDKKSPHDPWVEVEEVVPCSESTAVVTFLKESGMRCLIFAYHIRSRGGMWMHFMPTYEHLYGLKNDRLFETMDRVEEKNTRIRLKQRANPLNDAPQMKVMSNGT